MIWGKQFWNEDIWGGAREWFKTSLKWVYLELPSFILFYHSFENFFRSKILIFSSFFFWLHSLPDLCSLTKDWTCTLGRTIYLWLFLLSCQMFLFPFLMSKGRKKIQKVWRVLILPYISCLAFLTLIHSKTPLLSHCFTWLFHSLLFSLIYKVSLS